MSAGAGDSDIEKLARTLWGEPNRQKSTRDDIRYGTNGSKSVRPKDRTWYDHESNEGGGFVDLYQKAYGEVPSPSASGETAYDYRSPDGALLYQVVRRIPKDFRQRRPDGNGGWVWKMAGVVRVPYRLPELMGADPAVPVFICEGEKDCDALAARGFVTTTNPGGAGKWLPNMSAYLRGRDAIILPDNDQAGDDHALDVAAKLHGIARTVTIHRLPGLPVKGDVSDWLATGGNSDDLTRIVIQQTVPRAEPAESENGQPPEVDPEDPGFDPAATGNVLPFPTDGYIERPRAKPEFPKVGIKIIRYADIEPALDTTDLIEDYLGAGAMSVLYGESNSGKTFFATNIAFHVANGWEWNGRYVERMGVIYCAMEGTHGITNRVTALKVEYGIEDGVPMGIITAPLDLCTSDDDTAALIEAIVAEAKAIEFPTGLIIIDTVARAMAGGNENAPDDMGALVRNGDLIRSATGAHVMWIHHSGKDQARGARGHSSLRAATDTEIEISAENGTRTARVTKQREYECSGEFPFTLKVVEIGQTKRGKTLTSCVVTSEGETAPGKSAPRRRLTGNEKRAFDGLENIVGVSGRIGDAGVPSGYSSVPEKWWRDRFYETALPGDDQSAKQKAFRRAASSLIENRIVGMAAGRVWVIGQ